MPDPDPLQPELRKLVEHPYDQHAWERVYLILRPWLVGMAHAQLKNDISAAEDISQEVMLRLLRMGRFGPEFRDPKLFRGYVKRICQHLVIDWMRKRIHNRVSELLPEESWTKTSNTISRDKLWPLLIIGQVRDHLTQEETILLDLWLQGYSPGEMAGSLSLTVGTVYNQLTALRRRIRSVLEHHSALESR